MTLNVPLRNSLESGQAAGTTITTGNSGGGAGDAFSAITINGGCSATYEASPAMKDSLCARIFVPSNPLFVSIGYDSSKIGTVTFLYSRFYFNYPNAPAAGFIRNRPQNFSKSGVGNSATISIESGQKMRVIDAAEGFIEGTYVMSPDVLYRAECCYIAGASAGSIELRLYLGDNTKEMLDNIKRTGNTGTNADQVGWGCTNGEEVNGWEINFDDVAVSLNGWIGPSNQPEYEDHSKFPKPRLVG